MTFTNGDNLQDVVSLKDRFSLIKTWVLAKQMNQSPIKSFGIVKNTDVNYRISIKYKLNHK